MCLVIIDTGASTSEVGSPGQTSIVPLNQWSLRGTETFPDDLGTQQWDSSTWEYNSTRTYFMESLFSVDHVYRTRCHITLRIHSTLAIVKFNTLFSYYIPLLYHDCIFWYCPVLLPPVQYYRNNIILYYGNKGEYKSLSVNFHDVVNPIFPMVPWHKNMEAACNITSCFHAGCGDLNSTHIISPSGIDTIRIKKH